LREHLLYADFGGDLVGHGLVISSEQHRRQSQFFELGDGLRTGGFGLIGDDQRTPGGTVPTDDDRRLALWRSGGFGGLSFFVHAHGPFIQRRLPAREHRRPTDRPLDPLTV